MKYQYYSMNELWKHANWKKIVTKHLQYDSIYKKCPEQANLYRQKIDYWLPMAGGGRWVWVWEPGEHQFENINSATGKD